MKQTESEQAIPKMHARVWISHRAFYHPEPPYGEKEENGTFYVRQDAYDHLRNENKRLEEELKAAQEAIRLTLSENGHLADGDNCTLIHLKRVTSTFEPK